MGTADSSSQATRSSSRVAWGHLAAFVVLAFGFSWAVWIGLAAAGVPFVIRAVIGMFGPAVAAALVRGPLGHEGFADAGLRFGRRGQHPVRPYVVAYVTVPLLLAAGFVVALASRLQGWRDPLPAMQTLVQQQLASVHAQLPSGLSLSQLATIALVEQVVLAFTLAIPINMIAAFGEEFGWRGYLLPRLAPLGGVRATLLTGLVWGLWHAPLIALYGYEYAPPYFGSPWLGVLVFPLFTISFGAVLAWLRFRSGSVWPGALAHGALNAQAGLLILVLTPTGQLLRAPVGLLGIVPFALFAVWLALTGRLRPAEPTNAPRGAGVPAGTGVGEGGR